MTPSTLQHSFGGQGIGYFISTSITSPSCCVLKSILSLVFQWSEVFPSSIPKPKQVKVVGAVLQIIELMLYFPMFGVVGGYIKGKWWLAVWVAGVGFAGGVLRDLMISKFVPNSAIATNWDRYNVMGPAIIGAICIVQACRQPQAGHAPAFSTPGELLEAYNNPQVKAMVWLTEEEKGIFHQELLYKYQKGLKDENGRTV